MLLPAVLRMALQDLGAVDVWTPDVILWNSVDDITNTLAMQPVRVMSTGDVNWSRNGALGLGALVRGRAWGGGGLGRQAGCWFCPAGRPRKGACAPPVRVQHGIGRLGQSAWPSGGPSGGLS